MQDIKQIKPTKPVDKRSNEKQEGVVMRLTKFMRRMFENKDKKERQWKYRYENAVSYWNRHRAKRRRERLEYKKARRIYFKNQRGL